MVEIVNSPINDSKEPRKIRATNKEVKFLQPTMPIKLTDQKKMAIEITFPVGYLTSTTAPIGCITSCAKYKEEPNQEYSRPTRPASRWMLKTDE